MLKIVGDLEFGFNIVCVKVYAVYQVLEMESSFNQKLTKRSVTFCYYDSWQQCCECDD